MFGFTKWEDFGNFTVCNGVAKTFVGAFHETDVFVGYLAYEEGFVEVAVVSFVVDGDVQIHDVAALQLARIGNAMTNHFIDGTRCDENRVSKGTCTRS